jgi:MFS family permease
MRNRLDRFLSKETAKLDNSPAAENQKRASTPRYAYVILLVCFLIMTLVYGSQTCFGVFFKPMIADFGWSRAATSGPFALNMIVSGVMAVITGRLSDRLGPRFVLTISSLIFGAGFILMSRITNLWQLYIVYGVVIAAGSSGMYTPLVAMLTRWFPAKRGLMAGIGISGIGFGMGVIPVLASALIVGYNWRTSILVLGIICLILVTLLAQLAKTAREQVEAEPVDSSQNRYLPPPPKDYTFSQAIHTSTFWLFFIAWVAYGFFFQIANVHVVPYATDIGLSVTAAATVLTIIGLVGTAARIGLGFLGDHFGLKTMILISFGALALAYLGLAISHSIWMLYAFGIVYGCFSGIGVLLAPTVAELFGFKALGIIVGTLVMANCLGGAVSPPLAGAIFDMTGSYQIAFISCGLLGLVSLILMALLKRPNRIS